MTIIKRQRFDISITDTDGDYIDTGSEFEGAILQIRYVANTDTGTRLDTGTDIKLELAQSGLVVLDYDNIGTASWTVTPKTLVFDTGGAATGGEEFMFSVSEPLKLTVNLSDGNNASDGGSVAKSGTLYVWTG
jgi:hypothetical protein